MAAARGSGEDGASDRKHVDALLDISEEELLKELQPQRHRSYEGWDEAVRGWTRSAPLSCLFLTQKDGKKPKQNPPTPNGEGCVTSNAPDQSNQPRGHAAPPRAEAPRWPSGSPETTEDLREGPVEIRPPKPPKPTSTVVPIRHFTFLPPIGSPGLHPQTPGGGARAPEGRNAEETGLTFDRKNRSRGTRAGALRPESPAGACRNNPRSLSAHSSYLMAAAPKCTNAQVRRRPSGEKVLHVGAAATPSKTVCAVNL